MSAKARATGIHLVLATQHPDKDVVNPQPRSNLGNQIALKTRDIRNSEIILGESLGRTFDASRLLGKDHMICNFEGNEDNEPFYAQAAFIDNDMLGILIKLICKRYGKQD